VFTRTYLKTHYGSLDEQVTNMSPLRKIIIGGAAALILALGRNRYKPAHHAEFGPVDALRILLFVIPIVFLSLDHVGNVNLPRNV
jgi:hypothetical protein